MVHRRHASLSRRLALYEGIACALLAGGCDAQSGGQIAGGDDSGVSAMESGARGGGGGDTGAPPSGDASSQEASGGSSGGGTDSGGGSADTGGGGSEGGGIDAPAEAGPPPAKQALLWLWQNYAQTLSDLQSNPMSFTHISPTFYQLNYGYSSGAAGFNGSDNFDGMTSMQIAQQIHAMGMKVVPAVQAGAGNNGTDQGIQNVLGDSPSGAQQSFITSMVAEGVAKAYDGFNLDWEPGKIGYSAYGAQYVSFLAKFKSALNAKGMVLSIDIGSWYVHQCQASCGDGLVDLVQVRQAVDQAIIMDYTGTFGGPPTSCPAQLPMQQDCDSSFVAGMSVMCNLPAGAVSIGMISGQTNSYLPQALQAVSMYGFPGVAVWPSYGNLDSSGIPQGGTWYSEFAQFLAQ